jgi:hypothetical protein
LQAKLKPELREKKRNNEDQSKSKRRSKMKESEKSGIRLYLMTRVIEDYSDEGQVD